MQTDPITIATHTLTRHNMTENIILRVTPTEKSAIDQVARELGHKNTSSWVRELMSEGLRAAAAKRASSSEAA